MSLVKTSELQGRGTTRSGRPPDPVSPAPAKASTSQRRALERILARREKAAERIGAATEELAAGVAQASAAAEELRRALEQISSAAEQAAGASHESQTSIVSLGATFTQSRDRADQSRRKTEILQASLIEIGKQTEASVGWVKGQCRPPASVRRYRHHLGRAGCQYRRHHPRRRRHFGPNQLVGTERRHRSRARRGARAGFCRGGR